MHGRKNNNTGEVDKVQFDGGQKSKIALEEGTILTYSMMMEDEEITDSLRYVEYSMISMPTTLGVGDYVDIRLRLPNSQDLIVISKKKIENLYNETIGFNLTEEEILILNSAIVEAYIMTASELYIATYVEPGIQTAAILTYVPTTEVEYLIKMDQNIVTEAKEGLQKIYSVKYDTDGLNGPDTTYHDIMRGNINVNTSIYANEAKYNIEAGIQEQIEAARQARENYLSGMSGY